LKYFKEKVLSLRRAAELAGLSKWDFIEYLSDNDVPVVDYDQDEITRELEAAEKLLERLKK
jgi:predicted HTH domain antitoxin